MPSNVHDHWTPATGLAELDTLLRALAPSEDVRHHFRNARIEVLKGLRGLIDERIQRLSTESQKGASVLIE